MKSLIFDLAFYLVLSVLVVSGTFLIYKLIKKSQKAPKNPQENSRKFLLMEDLEEEYEPSSDTNPAPTSKPREDLEWDYIEYEKGPSLETIPKDTAQTPKEKNKPSFDGNLAQTPKEKNKPSFDGNPVETPKEENESSFDKNPVQTSNLWCQRILHNKIFQLIAIVFSLWWIIFLIDWIWPHARYSPEVDAAIITSVVTSIASGITIFITVSYTVRSNREMQETMREQARSSLRDKVWEKRQEIYPPLRILNREIRTILENKPEKHQQIKTAITKLEYYKLTNEHHLSDSLLKRLNHMMIYVQLEEKDPIADLLHGEFLRANDEVDQQILKELRLNKIDQDLEKINETN